MGNVSAIVIREHGEPSEVVKLEQLEVPAPGPGEARVRVLYAPINPADINVLEGKYPVRPALPGTPGVEGVGVVEEIGPDVRDLPAGSTVLLPHRFGTWRAGGVAAAADLVVVPGDIPLEQAAMLRVNPPTALLMLREFVKLAAGEWVVQNAANSAVGRDVIGIARHYGWKTVNIVRRPELVEELKAAGADVVLVDGESTTREIQQAVGGSPIRLALNAVGGDSATRIANSLGNGGVVVTYGAMSRQPLRIPNGLLIFKDIAWRGFWVTGWFQQASPEARATLMTELFDLTKAGVVHSPVEAVYPLEEIAEAVKHAQRPRRSGKVLLKCS